jgi:hypothetical protein
VLRTDTPESSEAAADVRRASELVFAPATLDEFAAEHLDVKPFHASRPDDPDRFRHLLSDEDVDRLVTTAGLRHPAFRMVVESRRLDWSSYTDDLPWSSGSFTDTADVAEVVAAFHQGATIVLQALHYYWLPLTKLCRALEHGLGERLQANAYYTPPSAQGLALHYDTHDVVLLQVSGTKRWQLYEPWFELPLPGQRRPRESDHAPQVYREYVTAPGSTLYIPRGWGHAATATESEPSLHITLGVQTYTWIDALLDAVRDAAADKQFRRAVTQDPVTPASLIEYLQRSLEPSTVGKARSRALLRSQRPVLDGHLLSVARLDDLTADTPVWRRHLVATDLEVDHDLAILHFERKSVRFPAYVYDTLAYVVSCRGAFRVRDLPGDLDESSVMVLVRRLVAEGLLATAPAAGSLDARPTPTTDDPPDLPADRR